MTIKSDQANAFEKGGRLMRRLGRMLGRLGFGVVVVVAMAVALIATTFIGVLLSLAALFLTLTRSRRTAAAGAGTKNSRSEEPVTLEARPTASGWVIERGVS